MQVAQHLASQLPSTFGYFVDNPDSNGSVLLTITNANGFTLRGVTVNAITQATQSGNTAVTRSTQVTVSPGGATDAPVLFTSATVTLAGTTAVGDLWSLSLGGVVHQVTSTNTSLATVAGLLRSAFGAGGTGNNVVFSSGTPFAVAVTISGLAPGGSAIISGTPTTPTTVPWTEADILIPDVAVRLGEKWTVTLSNVVGSGTVAPFYVVQSGDHGTQVVNGLITALAASGYSATLGSDGLTLEIQRAAAFTSSVAVAVAGSGTVDSTDYPARTVTIGTANEAGRWTITLSGAGNAHADVLAANDPTAVAAALATALATAFPTDWAFSASAGVLTIVHLVAGGSFTASATFAPTADVASGTTGAVAVTIPTPAAGDTFTLTVDGNPYYSSAATAAAAAIDLAGQLDALTGYTARPDGAVVTIASTTGATVTASLTLDHTLPATDTVTHEYLLSGTPLTATGTWHLAVDGGGVNATVTTGEALSTIALDLATQINVLLGSLYFASASSTRLTITRLDNTAFTATMTGDDAALAVQTPTTRVEIVAIPALTAGQAPTLTMLSGTTVLGTATGTTAAGFASTITGTANAFASGTSLVVVRSSTSAFTFRLTTTVVGAVDTLNGVRFTFTGSAAQGETWSVDAGAATGSKLVGSGEDIDDVIDALVSQLDSTGYVAMRQGSTITLASASSLSPRTTSLTPSAASTSSAALVTHTLTTAGTGNAGDTWTLRIDGAPRQYPVPAATTQTAAQVAAGLDGLTLPAGFTSFAIGTTLYVTGAASFALTIQVDRSTSTTVQSTTSGTPKLAWAQDVVVVPAGPSTSEPQLGDTWTLVVGTTTYTLVVTATGASYTVQVNGTAYSVPTTAVAAEKIALGFSQALGGVSGLTVSESAGHLYISSNDGSPLTVGPLTQVRRAVMLDAPTATGTTQIDDRVHYSTAIFTLQSDEQTAWSGGETWTVEINGVPFSYQVPMTGPIGTLADIATQLASTIDADAGLTATASGETITVTDATGKNPFSFKVSRGSGRLTAVFDIDSGNTVDGYANVPVVLPWYQWLVDLYPWIRPYVQTIDLVHYTARPAFQLVDGNGTVLKTVNCTITPGTSEIQGQATRPTVCSSVADPGQPPVDRPAHERPVPDLHVHPGRARTRSGSAPGSATTRRRCTSARRTACCRPASTASRPA